MAISDWNTANSARAYPFQENQASTGLKTSEILDARFFIVNAQSDTPKVWLSSKETIQEGRRYTFQTSAFTAPDDAYLVFTVPDAAYAQCIWNTDNPKWNGYCVFGPKE